MVSRGKSTPHLGLSAGNVQSREHSAVSEPSVPREAPPRGFLARLSHCTRGHKRALFVSALAGTALLAGPVASSHMPEMRLTASGGHQVAEYIVWRGPQEAPPEDRIPPAEPFFTRRLSNVTLAPSNVTLATPYQVFFHHVAKTAGMSFRKDGKTNMPAGGVFESAESCVNDAPKGVDVAVFVREPRAHVYSQWLHCHHDLDMFYTHLDQFMRKHDKECRIRKMLIPRHQQICWGFHKLPSTMTNWLSHWVKFSQTPQNGFQGFNCYPPNNLQTRLNSCPGKGQPGPSDVLTFMNPERYQGNLSRARAFMERGAAFVGVTELYNESVCLFRILLWDEFPKSCECNSTANGTANRTADQVLQTQRETHGSPKHSVADLAPSELGLITELTREDDVLYTLGVRRFLANVAMVEARFRRRVLCGEFCMRGPRRGTRGPC